jgi:hypothetical protein
MQLMNLPLPIIAAVLLVPAWGFAALALLGDAPGEWGRGALIAWTALVAALLAGAGLQSGGSPVPWVALALGLAAVMLGGPPGLAAAAVAAGVLLLAGPALPAPAWLPVALALPAGAVAIWQMLGR